MGRRCAFVIGVTLSCALPALATSYPPVTFDELVTRADVIFVGEVTDVRPFPLTTRDGTIIRTRVIFRVLDPIWGTRSVLEVLEFLGGEWDGIEMAVAEMPTFAVGDRRVVFARRERSINPIVGFRQGLFQVRRDSRGVDRVLTLDGLPVERPENFGTRTPAVGAVGGAALPLSEFRDRISRVLIRGAR